MISTKIGIPDNILLEPGNLKDEERGVTLGAENSVLVL
jgi:response regulator RpfG family c-di-GMP phosphodiesterase